MRDDDALPMINPMLRRLGVSSAKARQFLLFATIGALGTVINTFILWMLHANGTHYLAAAFVATETAIISNFIGNDLLTFHNRTRKPFWKRFTSFQAVSLFTLVGTLTILFILTSLLGEERLLLWNLVAIGMMFVANFSLNRKVTWLREERAPQHSSLIIVIAAMIAIALAPMAFADNVAVGQIGYHPDSHKQVVVYTDAPSGTFTISGTSYTGTLAKPKDASGQTVTCQGGQACLVGDFSDFTQKGTYTISAGALGTSPQFRVANDVYSGAGGTLLAFFDAQRMVGSDFHADMNQFAPGLTHIADGSFIMEADQASFTLMRLGSAYRRNPSLFSGTDLQQTIGEYADFLMSLQGVQIQADADGFRLGRSIDVEAAFVPGPTDLAELAVYDASGSLIMTVPVTSLCAENGTADAACLAHAAQFYKCQADEVCLDMSYNGPRGSIAGNSGYEVATGWQYAFGCYYDVDLQGGNFNDAPNPCMIFDTGTSAGQTARALLGLLEAYPAVSDANSGRGSQLLARAEQTYAHLKGEGAAAAEPGAWGASLFLLYDYTGKQSYLTEAHALRASVPTQLETGITHANEYYWEEYVRHEDEIRDAGLPYEIGSKDPKEYFTGKMIHDWQDRDLAISGNGERVYLLNTGGFHESRFMLLEGIQAAKSAETGASDQYPFIDIIADGQLAWLTGQNQVQDGESASSPKRSYSFIFGVGDNPDQFHTRLLMTTGYAGGSGGEVIGAHGTDFKFKDASGQLQWLDGRFDIVGHTLGALGNQYNGEAPANVFDDTQSFANGLAYIPGWINGAYDAGDSDAILNYHDSYHSFRHTETTNEIVAAAVELVAYLDAQRNGRPAHALVRTPVANFTGPAPNGTGSTISVTTLPPGALIGVDGTIVGVSPRSVQVSAGQHVVTATLAGYLLNQTTVTTTAGATANVSLHLSPQDEDLASLTLQTTPGVVSVSIDGAPQGTSSASGQLIINGIEAGNRTLIATRTGYATHTQNLTFAEGEDKTLAITLAAQGKNITSGAVITNHSTTLQGGELDEVDSTTFTVTLNASGTVTWTAPGIPGGKAITKQTTGTTHTFTWSPGIRFSGDGSRAATVTATAQSGSEQSWDLDVRDVINPFFDGPDVSPASGGSDMTLYVYVQNDRYDFDSLRATLVSASGQEHALVFAKEFSDGDETAWRATVTQGMLSGGENVLDSITGTGGNVSQTFDAQGLSHHKLRPQPAREQSADRGTSSARSAGIQPFVPDLIYTLFARDVVGTEEEQTLVMDVRSFENDIMRVQAVIESPAGDGRSIDLELTDGSRSYGTWEGSFSGFTEPGLHRLVSVTAYNARDRNKTFEMEEERRFYVVSDEVAATEELGLVYVTISHSTVESGDTVLIRLDARDASGVTGVTANITNNRGPGLVVDFDRVGGSATYGTYEAAFVPELHDSTYTVSTVTLTNNETERTYNIADRAVYVRALPPELMETSLASAGAGTVRSVREILRHPMTPAILGAIILVVGLTVVFAKDALLGRLRD